MWKRATAPPTPLSTNATPPGPMKRSIRHPPGPVPAIAAQRPNILFFLADDQRNDTLGLRRATRSSRRRPSIALAAEGVRFENTFVTTSICAASRATIFTGLYERTHGYTFGTPPIAETPCRRQLPGRAARGRLPHRLHRQVRRGRRRRCEARRCSTSSSRSDRNPYFKKQPDGSLRHDTEIAGDRAIEFLRTATRTTSRSACRSASTPSHAEDGDKRPGIGHYPWPKARRRHVRRRHDPAAAARRPGDLREPARVPQEVAEPRPLLLALGHAREVPDEHPGLLPHDQRRRPRDRPRAGRSSNARASPTTRWSIYTGDNGYYMGRPRLRRQVVALRGIAPRAAGRSSTRACPRPERGRVLDADGPERRPARHDPRPGRPADARALPGPQPAAAGPRTRRRPTGAPTSSAST